MTPFEQSLATMPTVGDEGRDSGLSTAQLNRHRRLWDTEVAPDDQAMLAARAVTTKLPLKNVVLLVTRDALVLHRVGFRVSSMGVIPRSRVTGLVWGLHHTIPGIELTVHGAGQTWGIISSTRTEQSRRAAATQFTEAFGTGTPS